MKQIELSNFSISNDKELTIIGGMNVLESHSLAMQVAEHFKKVTEKLNLKWVFKASFDKANRSSIDSFRGLGFEEGLKIVEDISSSFDVPDFFLTFALSFGAYIRCKNAMMIKPKTPSPIMTYPSV